MFSTTLVSPSLHNQHMIVVQLIFLAARGSEIGMTTLRVSPALDTNTCCLHFRTFFWPPRSGSSRQGHVETGNICASVSVCRKELSSFNSLLCYSNWYNSAVFVLVEMVKLKRGINGVEKNVKNALTLFFFTKKCEKPNSFTINSKYYFH